MKRVLIIALACLLALSLVACGGGGGGMADGVYTARADAASAEAMGHGFADELVLTYSGGAVTDVQYRSLRLEDGVDKATLSFDEYPMDPLPADWMPTLAQNVQNASSADSVDAVTGATNSSDAIRQLYKAIEENGKPGEVVEVTLTAE